MLMCIDLGNSIQNHGMMSILELNAYKLELLRQIMNDFNTEASLRRLAAACRLILQEEEQQLPAMPADLLCQLMDNAAKEDAYGLCISDEQLEKEMQTWQSIYRGSFCTEYTS